LAEFNFEIKYLEGKENVGADALSRLPGDSNPQVNEISFVHPADIKNQIRRAYSQDPDFGHIIAELNSKESSGYHQSYILDEDLLFLKSPPSSLRLCVPSNDSLRTLFLQESHDSTFSGHFGADKTYQLLYRDYFWPRMWQDCKAFTESCLLCQKNKSSQSTSGLAQPLQIPSKCWDHMTMDFVVDLPKTKNGFNSITVFVDKFSRMAHFVPSHTTDTAVDVAKLFFHHIFKFHGIPSKIVSDRDPKFTSNFWQALFKLLGSKLALSTAFHPQTDGTTERVNRTLEQMLRNYVGYRQDDWDILLTPLEFAYNNAPQKATGFSPFFLNSGHNPNLPSSLIKPQETPVPAVDDFINELSLLTQRAKDEITAAQIKQQQYQDANRKEELFEVGEEVLLSTKHLTPINLKERPSKKLQQRFVGPFKILTKIGQVAYRLDLGPNYRIHNVFHVSLLKKLKESPSKFSSRVSPPPEPDFIGDEREYEVEEVLDKRKAQIKKKSSWIYLIKWKGFTLEDATWESLHNLTNAQDAIAKFEAKTKNL
jgi:transposase InsO family protein